LTVRFVGSVLCCFCAAICLSVCSGCVNAPAVSDGRKAEKEGAAPAAYEDYCKAARKSPGDASAVAGIKRTGPSAAAHWQAQAWQAMEQRLYGEAWRMLMRALEIRPDDPTVVKLLRQLQDQHPAEVAEARADWLRRGSGALAMANLDEGTPKAESAQAAGKPVAVAKAEPRQTAPDRASEPGTNPPPAGAGGGDSGPPQGDGNDAGLAQPGLIGDAARDPQAKPADKEPPPAAGEGDLSESQKRHREWADAFARVDAGRSKEAQKGSEEKAKPAETKRPADPPPPKPVEAKRPAEPPPPKPVEAKRPADPPPPKPVEAKRSTDPPPAKPVETRRSVPPPPMPKPPPARESKGDPGAEQLRPRAAEAPEGFLVLRTLSKKDKVFPKEVMLVDGILIKLKGTGDEPKTDIELYNGKKRIKKFKGMRLGSSETFPGASGIEYRLIVLSIQHKTDTVRVGVQALPRVMAPAPAPKG
jgi:hypothetical protein